MRRYLPALLTVAFGILFVPALTASIPAQRTGSISKGGLDLSDFEVGSTSGRPPYLSDPHPFSTEFYLREFASESAQAGRQQRSSWFSVRPVTNAASSLSHRVANLRRALVRMMP